MQPLRHWNRLSRYPFGKRFFSWLIGRIAPYTGTISPLIQKFEEGKIEVLLRDRKRVRNHLNSIHAIALMNVGEVSTGLAVVSTLPENARAIIVHLEIDFIKKARGPILSSCEYKRDYPIPLIERKEVNAEALLTNAEGVQVAKVRARWLVGPK